MAEFYAISLGLEHREASANKLLERFDKTLRDFPDKRRRMLGRLGSELEEILRNNIPVENGTRGSADGRATSARVYTPRRPPGTVRRSQWRFIGDGGGYVAIRPDDKPLPRRLKNGATVGGRMPNDSGRVVMKALEGGHPRPRGLSRPDEVAAAGGWVMGAYPYRTTRARAQSVAKKHFNQLVQEIKTEMSAK